MSTKNKIKTEKTSILRRPFRVVAVTSGKGGVGKTNLVVNLGLAFAKQGRRVLIIDGDLGLANVDILLDQVPEYTLEDVLTGRESIENVLIEAEENLTILPAASGVAWLAALSTPQRLHLMSAVESLGDRFDTVLIDTPAGVGPNALFFASAAQDVVVVATPEPTAIADAYAIVKILALRCGVERIGLVANRVRSQGQAADLHARLSGVVSRFLPVVMEFVGMVPEDTRLVEAVMSQQPVVKMTPDAPSSLAFRRLADTLLMRPRGADSVGRLQLFWQRLLQVSDDGAGSDNDRKVS